MPIGKRCKDRAVELGRSLMKEMRDAMEVLPARGRSKRFSKFLLVKGTQIAVFKKIAAIDETLRPIVIRDAENCIADAL